MVETIQVGEGGRKSKAPRWQFIVALIVGIVLAIAAGGFVRWATSRSGDKDTGSSRRLPEAVDNVQNLRISGNPEEAKKKLDAALSDSSTSNDVKYMLYIQEGNLATDGGRFAEAVISYEKAATIKETYEIAALLGDTYALADDKTKAIAWYKKAIPLIPKENNPLYNDDKKTLEDKVKGLEGQP